MQDFFKLLGVMLLVINLSLWTGKLFFAKNRSSQRLFNLGLMLFVVIISLAVMQIPIGSQGQTLLFYLNGILGQLSVTTMLLLSLWLAVQAGLVKGVPISALSTLWYGFFTFSIVFYPTSLGLVMLDPYSWGYASAELFLALLIIFIIICGFSCHILFPFIAFVVITGFLWQVFETDNFWDYFFDIYIVVFAWCWIIVNKLQTVFAKEKKVV